MEAVFLLVVEGIIVVVGEFVADLVMSKKRPEDDARQMSAVIKTCCLCHAASEALTECSSCHRFICRRCFPPEKGDAKKLPKDDLNFACGFERIVDARETACVKCFSVSLFEK